MRFVLLLTALCSFAFAQTPYTNSTGVKDTQSIVTFKADSLKYSRTFLSSGDNRKILQIIADDTSANTGHGSDSIKFFTMVQGGWPYITIAGALDTIWTQAIILDTFSMATAKLYNSKNLTGAAPWNRASSTTITQIFGQVDTGENVKTSSMWVTVDPFAAYVPWTPWLRFSIKGLSGNKVASFVRLKLALIQQAYTNIRSY